MFTAGIISRASHLFFLSHLLKKQAVYFTNQKGKKMTDQEKMQYIQYMAMKDELDNVAYGGIRLSLDGKLSSARSIAAACVFREDNDYMRDYQRDKEGRIAMLNFNQMKDFPF